jgi:DNA-binding CsgD family transcriptional regulator
LQFVPARKGASLDDSSQLEKAALRLLEMDAQPRAMVDDQLTILWSNPAAAILLASKRDIGVRNGLLYATDHSQQEALHNFVRDCRSGLATWCLLREDAECLLLRAQRVKASGETVVCLAFIGTGPEYEPRYHDLDKAFGLTLSEHRVLLALLAGNEAEALARLHGVSVETTRTHIRNIYAKLGVSSRERLFNRTQPFRI